MKNPREDKDEVSKGYKETPITKKQGEVLDLTGSKRNESPKSNGI